MYFASHGYNAGIGAFLEGLMVLAESGLHRVMVTSNLGESSFAFKKEDGRILARVGRKDLVGHTGELLEYSFKPVEEQIDQNLVIILLSESCENPDEGAVLRIWLGNQGRYCALTIPEAEVLMSHMQILLHETESGELLYQPDDRCIEGWSEQEIFIASGINLIEPD